MTTQDQLFSPLVADQHFLIVTPDADYPTDEDLLTYDAECPGVTDSCRRYEDCRANEAEADLLEAAVDNGEPAVAHGAKHLKIDGLWCAATDNCNVISHDGLPATVAGRFEPGRHPIDFDFGDGTEIVILPIEAVNR